MLKGITQRTLLLVVAGRTSADEAVTNAAITVTNGNLLLATATTLDVAGTLTVDAKQTISLGIDGIKFSAGKLSATGGTVEIAPLSSTSLIPAQFFNFLALTVLVFGFLRSSNISFAAFSSSAASPTSTSARR